MTVIFHAPTIADLINVLKDLPANAKWYGYNDETIIVCQDNGPKAGYQELAYITPEKEDT